MFSMNDVARAKFLPVGAKALLLTLVAMSAGAGSSPGPDLLKWPDCPPGIQYGASLADDPRAAHFQSSPVAGPSGGTCSLDVVTGAVFSASSNGAGGVEFATPGEAAGVTYTLAFDMQWVHGENEWFFANEAGNGVVNGIAFSIPYPGDMEWHHYEWSAAVGSNGPQGALFIYQGRTAADPAPVLGEMRIDNMTLRQVDASTPSGLVISDGDRRGGGCSGEHRTRRPIATGVRG